MNAITAAVTFAAQLLLVGAANAETLVIKDYGPVNGFVDGYNNQSMTLNFPAVTSTNGGPVFNTIAGSMNIKDSNNNNYIAYCIDPLTYLNSPASYSLQNLETYLDPSAAGAYNTQFQLARYVDASNGTGPFFTNQRAVVESRLNELYKYAYKDSLTNSVNGAAFQYAIWELVGENDAQLGAGVGGLTMTNNALAAARADQYLTALTAASEVSAWSGIGLSANANTYIFNVWVPSPSQSGSQAHVFVTEGGPTGGSNVPEPSTAALGLLGALAAMRSLKGRRKTPLHR
jgi:hypothetical protein